ncbi:alcohol dehydrogenase [Oligella sp. HMSC05A10]|uniref:zinc-dependent alcohol dehydrogenase family protein n=1 Tax=Oligella sp. HMSC05A10 TaxID=1581112 RepID=UPI0008A2F9C7|nr:zinc-dependent alcohol dehydrogenase family protein [Oligella sp. HMSC05A10]OFS85625.1 alcohol dehydrogenase [Oligella sp. HMSC05A10]
MRFRAAVLREMSTDLPYSASKPVSIEEVSVDPPAQGEVLVKIRAAGLCHSDLSVINGDRPRGLPIVLGHEASAEVVELGAGVKELSVGDHVVLVFVPSCGCCLPCSEGRPALCVPGQKANSEGTLLGGDRRLRSQSGEVLNHQTGVSCFAEYAVVSARSCVKIERDLSHREAALFGCAVLTGAGAVINRAKVKAGDTVAIVGLGGVGFSALLAAVASGARRIVAVDLSDEKLDLAKKMGATHAINPTYFNSPAELLDAAGGGVDYGLDMAGAVNAFETAHNLTKKGGATITSGLPNPRTSFALSLVQLVGEERTIQGSYLGSGVPTRDIERYIDLYLNGRLPVDLMMGKTFSLDSINEAFDHLASGSSLRDAIIFD